MKKLSKNIKKSNIRLLEILMKKGEPELKTGITLLDLLKRPAINYKDIKGAMTATAVLDTQV